MIKVLATVYLLLINLLQVANRNLGFSSPSASISSSVNPAIIPSFSPLSRFRF